jgi:aminotransferase EvaB
MIPIPINEPVRAYHRIRPQIDAVVQQVISSGRWIDGPFTRQFAADFAAWCGVSRCVLVGNGTDALELALRALGVGPGDEVITVANAGGFTTRTCRLIGAVPVWIDVQPDTLGLDPDLVSEVIGVRTKVVVATHLYGIAADVIGLRRILDRSGRSDVRILEDCAQAHGATCQGRRVGSLGDIAAFSFYPTKNLGAFGDAGAVLTNNDELAERVERLRFHGWKERFRATAPFGRNSRIDEIQSAVLALKLQYLDAWNAERREIIQQYAAATTGAGNIVGANDPTNVGHLAILRTPARATVQQAMSAAGIATDIHYPVLDYDQVSELGLPGRKTTLTVSEGARGEILTLPCYPGLTRGEIERVSSVLKKCLDN